MLQVRDWGVIGLAGAAGVWWLADDVLASRAEEDLSRIGNGIPSIVQIHDPSCAMCAALQRETRAALGAFEDDALTYVVANIRTAEGRRFANQHGASHVTLLLFDGAGRHRRTITGVQSADALQTVFRTHLADRSATERVGEGNGSG